MSSSDQSHEAAWLAGYRAACVAALRDLSTRLGPGAEKSAVVLQIELEETRLALRRVCARHGDNDWDDLLHLADVVEKHLAPYLGEKGRPR